VKRGIRGSLLGISIEISSNDKSASFVLVKRRSRIEQIDNRSAESKHEHHELRQRSQKMNENRADEEPAAILLTSEQIR